MSITATELRKNLSKYLEMSLSKDIYITKNGKIISKLTNPFQKKLEIVDSLVGVIDDSITLEKAKEDRLSK